MRTLQDYVKAVKAIEPINLKAADELKKEIAENKEAMADLENEPANEPVKKELISDLEIFHTKPPPKPTHMDCPFCESEKTIKGMNRHIAAIHKVPGVTIQDLDDAEEGLKSLPDLVREKFEGEPMISNLSPDVDKEYFSDWGYIEENPEDLEDPEDQEIPEDLEPKEKGESMAGLFAALGTIAAVIISRNPQIKEIFAKIADKRKHLGSKKPMSFSEYAAKLNKEKE